MNTVDPKTVAAHASRTNLVPSVLWAYGQQAHQYGHDTFTDDVVSRKNANELADAIEKYGSVQRALSFLKTGDPEAYQSSTHPAAGYVAGVMGLAGSRPSYGMEHFIPASPEAFSGHAGDVHEVFDSFAQLGGVVTHEGVAKFAQDIAARKPPTPGRSSETPISTAKTQAAIKPSGPNPRDVAEFQRQASSLGIDPEHLAENLPFAASLSRKLLGKSPTLEDYAQMAQMNKQEMQAHINSQPHPSYPEITAGQYHSAYAQAMMHSWKTGSMPHPSEVARFAALGHDAKQIQNYYDDRMKMENPTHPLHQDHSNVVQMPKRNVQ